MVLYVPEDIAGCLKNVMHIFLYMTDLFSVIEELIIIPRKHQVALIKKARSAYIQLHAIIVLTYFA